MPLPTITRRREPPSPARPPAGQEIQQPRKPWFAPPAQVLRLRELGGLALAAVREEPPRRARMRTRMRARACACACASWLLPRPLTRPPRAREAPPCPARAEIRVVDLYRSNIPSAVLLVYSSWKLTASAALALPAAGGGEVLRTPPPPSRRAAGLRCSSLPTSGCRSRRVYAYHV